jgi:hypothetical protein
MITPQLTEQYGHVLRVSVVRDNLKARTSANAMPGDIPNPTIEDEPIPAAQILKNCLRFMGAFMNLSPAVEPPVPPTAREHNALLLFAYSALKSMPRTSVQD